MTHSLDDANSDDYFLQWNTDHFPIEILEDSLVIPNVHRRRMLGMLNLRVDWQKHRPVLIVDQDECIVKCGEMQKYYWMSPGHKPTESKSEGSGFMLSGFRLWGAGGFIGITNNQKDAAEKIWKENADDADFATPDEEKVLDNWMQHEGRWWSYRSFEYGKARAGYWDGEKMSVQARQVMVVLEFLYPEHNINFIFDWSSCHDKAPEENVHAKDFKATPGFQAYSKEQKADISKGVVGHKKGESKELTCKDFLPIDPEAYPNRAAGWIDEGKIYFRFREGEVPIQGAGKLDDDAYVRLPKGLKQLLLELGLNANAKRKVEKSSVEDSLEKLFMEQSFIREQPSLLQKACEKRGHTCLMLPKCHPEFNPIERVWGRMKLYTRAHNNNQLPTLRKNVPVALSSNNIRFDLHYLYERKSRDYMRAYLKPGCTDPFEAKAMVGSQKVYRSHRGIPPSEFTDKRAKPWDLLKLKLKGMVQAHLAS